MEKFEGIIISSNQYKDSDFIINVLSPKGEIKTITVRGGMKVDNENKEFQNPFVIAEFETYQGGVKQDKLRRGEIKYNLYEKLYENFEKLEIYGLLVEILKKFPPLEGETSYYKLLYLTIKNLITKDESYKYTLMFLMVYIKLLGYKPLFNIDEPESDDVFFDPNQLKFVENIEVEESSFLRLNSEDYIFLAEVFDLKYRELETYIDDEESKKYIKILSNYLSLVSETKINGFLS